MRVVLRDHAAAQPAAELDRPARFVTEEVFDQKRNAAEGTGSEHLLIEAVNPIRVRFDDGVDGSINRGDRRRRCLGELLRRYLFARDQLGKAKRIVAGVFGKVHHALQTLSSVRRHCRRIGINQRLRCRKFEDERCDTQPR